MTTPTSRDLFEKYAAEYLGHTTAFIRASRAITTDKYHDAYIDILYNAWKMAWQTANEVNEGKWDNVTVDEVK